MASRAKMMWALAITSTALFMVVLDNLVVSTALPVIRVSLLCAAVLAVLLPIPDASWLLIALVVAGGPAVGSLWIPGMAVVSQAASHSGLDQGYAFALVNLVWAAAQTAGTAGGAQIAELGGDALAYGVLAVVFGIAFTVFTSARRRAPSPAAAGTGDLHI